MTITASATALRAELRRERTAAAGEPTKLAFVDFHIHTRFSRDSILTEERFIRLAIERGLTHAVITNHNNVEGAIAVRDKVAELGLEDRLTIVLGEEVSTTDGEVVGVFLQKTIPRGERDGGRDPSAGWARQHPASVRPVPWLAHQGGTASEPGGDEED
jgi:hypothetical protein